MLNLLHYTPNQATKFRRKNQLKVNDDALGTYKANSQTEFKTSTLKSSLCDNNDAYILVNKIIAGTNLAEGRGNNGIETVFKNCVPFTDCISKLNNTQIDNANGINVGRPMYSLIKYIDYYSKTSGSQFMAMLQR